MSLVVKGLRHAYLKESVPNDIQMPLSKLVTGANMGGKSTLLKALCIAVLLA